MIVEKLRANKLLLTSEDDNYFSFSLILKLVQRHKLNGNQITLYMAIADVLMNGETNAITLDYLSDVTGFNRTTVSHNVQMLAEKGAIERWIPENTINRTTLYELKMIE